jgi:hypothetical protein
MRLTITIRFYEELNDFLPPSRRKVRFTRTLPAPTTVKDFIEACGVPHPEVDLILVNGVSVDFTYLLGDGDDVSVYPVFESLDIRALGGVTRLQERPLRRLCFAADRDLGRLTRKLRLLGLDVAYDPGWETHDLIAVMQRTGRVILTHSRGLLMRKAVVRGYCVRAREPLAATVEVIHRFDLAGGLAPFTRCTVCNGVLHPVAKEEIIDQLQSNTRRLHDTFTRCSRCSRIYWPGSKAKKLAAFVEAVQARLSESPT